MRLSVIALCLTQLLATSQSQSTSTTTTTTLRNGRGLSESGDEESSHDHSNSHSHSHSSHDHNEDCNEYEIDFVLVEGDALRGAVEQEIVEMLEVIGVKVNTRKLPKDDFNAVEQAGDFHLSFSETWGAPYDPHAYAKGWIAGDEGHNQALSGLAAPNDSEALYASIERVLKETSHAERTKQWEDIHTMVHDSATMLPLWGARIPTVLNSNKLAKFAAGHQQFDYPVHKLEVLGDDATVTIAPGGQTGLFQTVGRLDPHTYRPNEFFSNNWVYEGLVSYGYGGQILPALASKWMLSEDGTTYTFLLRKGVTFHDGVAWDCAAAKLNFDHVLAEPLRGSDYHGWYGLMDQIDSWSCRNDFEFVVTTKDQYYPFLQELAFIRPLRMLSPGAFAGLDPYASNSCHVGWGTIEGTDPTTTVVCAGITNATGTGPFVLESRSQRTLDDGETVVDDTVVFASNDAYWDGASSIETLIVQRYESSEDVEAALVDGSLDVVWGTGVLTADQLVALDEDESNDLSVYHSEDIQNIIILLNSGKPPLDDINVRKSIIHAINKKKIIDDNLGGLYKPVDNVFPRDAPYCDVDITPRWDYDLEKAEFLNCLPDSSSGSSSGSSSTTTTTTTASSDDTASADTDAASALSTDSEGGNAAAIGLGVGLGAACLVILFFAGTLLGKNNELQTEVDQLKKSDRAVES